MASAIVKVGSKQFNVEKGVKVALDLISGKKPGDTVELDQVLLVRDGDTLKVGTPHVKGAKVTAKVIDTAKAAKIYSYKFRRREGYHRKIGHRQKYTLVEVTEISS